jgi:hypothetical protein
MKRVRVRCESGVRPAVRRELHRLAKAFGPVLHDVFVTAVPYPALGMPDGGLAWGMFLHPKRKRSLPFYIFVAADVPARDLRRGYVRRLYGRATAARAVGHSLLHELAHYEQWRDGRELIERGVNVRAASLYRRMK